MDFKNICINCMKEKPEGENVCPHCGFASQTYVIPQYVLPPYTILNGKYLLGKVLGMGGFGITYMALDLMLEHPVAIKEYFIQNIMYRNVAESSHVTIACSDIPKEKIYKISREKFENEAKTLASLSDLPGIVRVLDFFTEFNTAYIVMEYLSGMTLKEYVKEQGGKLSVKETREKLNPIMTSLQYVHDRNIIHRDISPDNMKVLDKGIASGTVKLFDFGGAGQEIRSEDDPKSAIVLKKDGYTPIEQIAGASNQGAWTDVYAMAATIYFCICGQPPLSANARVAEPDKFKTPTQLGVPIGKKARNINKEPDTVYEYVAGNPMDDINQIGIATETTTEMTQVITEGKYAPYYDIIEESVTKTLQQLSDMPEEQLDTIINESQNASQIAIASNWKSVREELGNFVEVASQEITEEGDVITVTSKAIYDGVSDKTEVIVTYTDDEKNSTGSLEWEIKYPISKKSRLWQRIIAVILGSIIILFMLPRLYRHR